MDIEVRHGTTNITSRVISYIREHNICTGIGRLQITLEGTYSSSISPHDTISIYENGDFKVKYYVSDVDRAAPEGTIRLECQDRSKYLVDYFIPDSYTVDYPSYTRYWIEKFFDEAGITYEFITDSQGNLLSNYTQLGLQPAYDQIMMLCQMSGWYFYFDGNGKAIIGSLTTDLSSGGSVGKTDILSIKKITDDKMLRNRAVVWGQFDPLNQEYAYADVSKHTPWNYDHNDLRTMVVSNNNIPNKSSAYSIANLLLKEFAKATIEKHITVHGARNLNLGETLGVDSHVWRGKGLITTFGVSMDRSGGLVTNLILDERCPRLFGFFNFGDFVYVGTFGDGVWKKHIRFDPTWYNFSTGLEDLHITDLHINNGIFGSIAHSGAMYYATSEAGPWLPFSVDGLESSSEDTVPSGAVIYTTFSGIKGRAVIVDKESNNLKYGVDTWSGLNTGDYFMTYSGLSMATAMSGVAASGVTASGGNRGWILEVDPMTGQLVGGLGAGIYPINYSGNYDIMVLDIENDGRNDYVSVATGGGDSVIPYSGGGFNYGKFTSNVTEDPNALVAFATNDTYSGVGETHYSTYTSPSKISVFNNEGIGEREVVYIQGSTMRRKKYTINPDNTISMTALTSPAKTGVSLGNAIGLTKIGLYVYRAILTVPSSDASNIYHTYYYVDWDTLTNTFGSDVGMNTFTIPKDTTKPALRTFQDSRILVIGDKTYHYVQYWGWANSSFPTDVTNYVKIYCQRVNMLAGSVELSGLVSSVEFQDATSNFPGGNWTITGVASTLPTPAWLLQNGEFPSLAIFVRESNGPLSSSSTEVTNYVIHSDFGTDFSLVVIQHTTDATDPEFVIPNTGDGTQLTGSGRFIWFRRTSDNKGYAYNGTTVNIMDMPSIPFQWEPTNIISVGGVHDTYYIAKNGTERWLCNPTTQALEAQISFPADYTIHKPFQTTSSYLPYYFWYATNDITGKKEILRMNYANYVSSIIPETSPGFNTGTGFGLSMGNFFWDTNGVMYVNNYNEQPIAGRGYLILRRDGSDYGLIQSASKPLRIDISNYSPVLSVQDSEGTFTSNFIYGNELTQISFSGAGLEEVRDYRYTLLETFSGMVVASGSPVSSQILYVNGSGIYSADAQSYSGGFMLMATIPSGSAERIETSNFVYPGQYLFVTTSGDNPMFFQRDNDALMFVSYPGLPDSRATIIRVDDRF